MSLDLGEARLLHVESLETRTLFAATASPQVTLRAGSTDPRFTPKVPPSGEMLFQSNGRELVFSTSYTTGLPVGQITAYNADGSPDATFDQVAAAAIPTGFNASNFGVAPDDKILLSGFLNQSDGVVRLNADGTLDTSFGANGVAVFPYEFAGYSQISQMEVGPGNQVVLLIQDDLVRLTPAGTLDPAFGTGGVVQMTDPSAPAFIPDLVTIQPDGKLLVSAETAMSSDGTERAAIICYNADGTPDAAFGTDAQATLGPRSFYYGLASPQDVFVLPDGNIDIFLDYLPDVYARGRTAGYVEQLTTSGALNRKFGNYGRANVALLSGGHFNGGSMLVDAQGNIIVASVQEFGSPNGPGGVGQSQQFGVDYDGVLRLNAAGHRDPRFGRDGVRIVKSEIVSYPGFAGAWFAPQNDDIVIELRTLSRPTAVYALLDSPLRV